MTEGKFFEIFDEVAKKYLDENSKIEEIDMLRLAIFSKHPYGFEVFQFSNFLDEMLSAVAKKADGYSEERIFDLLPALKGEDSFWSR